MIVVVDYGMCNVGSVINICRKAGAVAEASNDPARIVEAEKLILPGVGRFDNGMRNLRSLGLVDALNTAVLERKTPILGICLGMQLFTRRSEEGGVEGLGWVQADTLRFQPGEDANIKVPHMGWNQIEIARPSLLFEGLSPDPRFYFVHSYYVACDREEDVLARTTHGQQFVSALGRDNIWGTQFHPEKSHKFGLGVVANFIGRIG